VGTKENNKNIKMFKNKLWKRRGFTKVEIAMFRGNQIVKKAILLEKIQKNNTRE